MIGTFHFPIEKPDLNKQLSIAFIFYSTELLLKSPSALSTPHKKVTYSILQENQMQSFP